MEAAMDEEELRPKKKTHQIGEDLALLSVGELRERIDTLKAEIARLEAAIAAKEKSKTAADSVFRR
jgi:uncharacterized small protein (DUF1192 family)